MVRLRLLGGPAEEFQGIAIESEESEARYEAMVAHAAWLRSNTPADRERYAYRLLRWARLRRDRDAIRYAERLLGVETAAVRSGPGVGP